MAPKQSTQPRLTRDDQVDRLPGPLGTTWLVAELTDNEDELAARFTRKHGQPPEHILPHKGHLWLGPVPGQGGE